MVFNSYAFLVFFLCVYPTYLLLNKTWQNRLLLCAGYFFYGFWDWRFVFLLLASTTVDFNLGRMIDATEDKRAKRIWLICSMAVNLGFLGAFKYFNFFVESGAAVMSFFGWNPSAHLMHIVLPVGISFYTFQSMSYIIDVYRGELRAERKFLDFAAFVSFFPQLVAGPIERASTLLTQVNAVRKVTREKIADGASLFLWGLFKKVFIADNCAVIANAVFPDSASHAGFGTLIGVYAFAFQIYADFSGYSDMARGLSRLLGFELMRNFNLPYFSLNPAEFWRRWHISLSTWLRDYLYISLGGNRGGAYKTYRNLFLTMFLGGLWHGASWHFVMWGVYQGALLIVHRLLSPWLALIKPNGPVQERLWFCVRLAFMFQLICGGWILFRAQNMAEAWQVVRSIATDFRVDAASLESAKQILFLIWPLILVELFQFRVGELNLLPRIPAPAKAAFAACLAYLLFIHGASSDSFIYFQF
jgi:D-alanyl-lipoteichoic acid acyltransferase DltB (MBOAT superfamily)